VGWALGWLGLHLPPFVGPGWLEDVFWAKPALILMGIWGSMGGTDMILYLAALQGIPPELYEAAEIDGANAWDRFWKITWPMVSPTTFFIMIMGVIGGFQGGFNQAHVMTGGGPAGSTTTISYYIYQNAYVWFRMGYAASVAWMLFLVVFVLTMLNWRFGQKRVHYG
jgi:multiple sugar transport system permease protein